MLVRVTGPISTLDTILNSDYYSSKLNNLGLLKIIKHIISQSINQSINQSIDSMNQSTF